MATYKLISSVTVGAGGQASIDFTSIPQIYTDLLIKVSLRNGADDNAFYIRFNGSSTSYLNKRLYASGSGVSTDNGRTDSFNPFGGVPYTYTANTFGNAEIYIPNYTGTNVKSISVDGVGENNATAAYMSIIAGVWSNTSAITSVSILSNPVANTLLQYSTAYLYGIKNS